MKNRLLSLFLGSLLIFQCCVPALAADLNMFKYTEDTEVENIKRSFVGVSAVTRGRTD